MFGNIVEVIEVDLFLVDDGFEEFRADAVAVVAADRQELVVLVDCVVFQLGVKGENDFHFLTLDRFLRRFGGRFPVQFLDPFGEHLGMAHFVDGDQLHLQGQVAVIGIVQVVMLGSYTGEWPAVPSSGPCSTSRSPSFSAFPLPSVPWFASFFEKLLKKNI